MRLLSNLLTRFIRNGTMRVIDAEGTVHSFGGEGPGPTVTMRLHDKALYNRIALNPELYAGEAYMDGTLTFEDGSDVGDFMYSVFAEPDRVWRRTRHSAPCAASGAACDAGIRPTLWAWRRRTPSTTMTSRPKSTGSSSTRG